MEDPSSASSTRQPRSPFRGGAGASTSTFATRPHRLHSAWWCGGPDNSNTAVRPGRSNLRTSPVSRKLRSIS
ncbi:hypothetical protein ACIRYZ_25490 [Kitasatospora sp. NPDC101155]|uniref:hypothetical protein n=1 Tax=Kitasatospora sp. NPDC101155 TaxID=3364097 RepID=UPI003828E8B3